MIYASDFSSMNELQNVPSICLTTYVQLMLIMEIVATIMSIRTFSFHAVAVTEILRVRAGHGSFDFDLNKTLN